VGDLVVRAVGRLGTRPSVVLADPHIAFRTRLRSLLTDDGIDVLGEGSSGEEAVVLVRELAPDVVLLEIDLPDVDGVTGVERIGAAAPEVSVVILTAADDEDGVADAVLAGACGCLLKGSPLGEVVHAVHAAASGRSLVPPQIAARLLGRLGSTAWPAGAAGYAAEPLSRELELLRLLAAGRTKADIAALLDIPPAAVPNNFRRVLRKLQLCTLVQAAATGSRPSP
jgi:DNA-binding NarL/FixJ family response regulator